ncbi:MAG: metal ABC transporter substrate-binding protein [Alphaproteobacteria bacterium]|nr:metal ABC transporter substrate-binding protein [Alphaproteobacteria bacterium]
MYRLSRRLFLAALATLAVATTSPSWAADKLKVVTTFTILGDMVRNVGGEHIALTTLVGPDGDAHVYEPTPADARALAQTSLVIVNGLGFEGWIDRLVKASGYKGPVVVASDGISALKAEDDHGHGHAHTHAKKGKDHHHGELDPHAWQDLANGRLYVANIARALAAADPAHADDYRRRAEAYDGELVVLDRDIRRRLDVIPADRRRIVTSHDAFRYFGRAYGIRFRSPVGLSTESEPSAKQIAALIRQLKKEKTRALFVENITDPRLVQQLAREAGAVIGGTLYSDSLSGPTGPAPTYLDMFRHNVSEIAKAFTS